MLVGQTGYQCSKGPKGALALSSLDIDYISGKDATGNNIEKHTKELDGWKPKGLQYKQLLYINKKQT